jgi:hypothetical protein
MKNLPLIAAIIFAVTMVASVSALSDQYSDRNITFRTNYGINNAAWLCLNTSGCINSWSEVNGSGSGGSGSGANFSGLVAADNTVIVQGNDTYKNLSVNTSWADARYINEGTGVVSPTALQDTAVTPGTYGNASHVAQGTFDQDGRATLFTNVAISISQGAVQGLTTILSALQVNITALQTGLGTVNDTAVQALADAATAQSTANAAVAVDATQNASIASINASKLDKAQGCSDGEILEWNSTSGAWQCGIDNSASSGIASFNWGNETSSTSIGDGETIRVKNGTGVTVVLSGNDIIVSSTATGGGNTTAEIVAAVDGTYPNLDTDSTNDFDGVFSSLTSIPSGLSDGDDNTNANTICSGTTTYLDGEGNCDDISSVYQAAGTYYSAGGTDVPVSDGGTGRSTSTTAYGLIAAGTTATGAHQTLATGSSGQVLRSGGASALPAWSSATYPVSTTVNRILYSSATNVVGQITTANSGVLVTSGAGVPSIATDIPTAVTIGGAYVYRIGGTDVVDADVADALTVSGGTIGSNSISGTLTTTGTLTVGDGGDRIDVASDTWDVTNGVITGATYQGNAIGDSYISSASTWNAKAGTGNCAGSNSTHYAVTQNTTTGGVQCVYVPKEAGSGSGDSPFDASANLTKDIRLGDYKLYTSDSGTAYISKSPSYSPRLYINGGGEAVEWDNYQYILLANTNNEFRSFSTSNTAINITNTNTGKANLYVQNDTYAESFVATQNITVTSTTGCSYAGGRAIYCWNATETSFCGPSGDEGVCANQ